MLLPSALYPDQHVSSSCELWDAHAPLEWSYISAWLGALPCDVLTTVDACLSGSAVMNNVPGTSRFKREYIFSCNYMETTSGGASQPSFTKFLVAWLELYALRSKPFPVAHLYRQICSQIVHQNMFAALRIGSSPVPIEGLDETHGINSFTDYSIIAKLRAAELEHSRKFPPMPTPLHVFEITSNLLS